MADIVFNLPDFASDRKFYRSFQKLLDDVTYTFAIQYLSRQDRFMMSIGDQARGIAVQGGVDMLQQIHHLEVPPGELRLLDYDNLNRDPTRNTFGSRITFVYTEAE
jgi:hypothetical protein